MKWEELAYSLLEARPNDAVKLALAVAEGKPPNLKGADLRALVELEVKPGGGVRVELMDKGAALGAILKAGLPQNVAPHSLRKVYAVELLERYGDIQRVQRALNHSSIETTLIYAMADKLLDAKLKQAKRRKRPA